MPAGPVSMAGLLEWGTQEYEIHLDPRVVAGDFWAFTGSGGGGKRDRYAGGIEFGIPLTEKLRASLAGRYDKYDDITNVDDAFSYNVGLEYRPINTVLVRGSLATSFRAPDMHYVFADPSGYFTSVDDEYWCRANEPGTPLPDCSRNPANIRGESEGNPELEEEKGKSYTFGVVFQPTPNVNLSLDYYHIEIEGLVTDYPATKILETEADCRLGQTLGGTAVDINSAQCQAILARVQRTPVDSTEFSEYIDLIRTGPINTADYRTSGIDTTLSFRQDIAAHGALTYQLNYSHVLKFDTRDFAGDPFENTRDDPQIFSFRSKMRGSVTWEYADWTTTVFAQRLGSIPRWDETGRIGTQVTWSGSVGYTFLDGKAEASLFVDNLFDEPPPRDPSYDEYPYFSDQNYDPTGREWFLQLRYKFGL
jgi:outer membrane receptor protein involved in Fe transport